MGRAFQEKGHEGEAGLGMACPRQGGMSCLEQKVLERGREGEIGVLRCSRETLSR